MYSPSVIDSFIYYMIPIYLSLIASLMRCTKSHFEKLTITYPQQHISKLGKLSKFEYLFQNNKALHNSL